MPVSAITILDTPVGSQNLFSRINQYAEYFSSTHRMLISVSR